MTFRKASTCFVPFWVVLRTACYLPLSWALQHFTWSEDRNPQWDKPSYLCPAGGCWNLGMTLVWTSPWMCEELGEWATASRCVDRWMGFDAPPCTAGSGCVQRWGCECFLCLQSPYSCCVWRGMGDCVCASACVSVPPSWPSVWPLPWTVWTAMLISCCLSESLSVTPEDWQPR